MIKRMLCSLLIALLVPALGSAKELTVARDFKLSNGTVRPVVLELTSLGAASPETVSLHPYRVELAGIKSELEAYRWTYLVVMSVVVASLAAAVASK